MNADKIVEPYQIAEACLKSKHLEIEGETLVCGACWKLIEQAE